MNRQIKGAAHLLGRSFELRRVPLGYEHPVGSSGRFIPLFNGDRYLSALRKWRDGFALWQRGQCEISGGAVVSFSEAFGTTTPSCRYEDRAGIEPEPERYTPSIDLVPFVPGVATYETLTEGTPLSPIFTRLEPLCAWLASHRPQENMDRALWMQALLPEWNELMGGLSFHYSLHAEQLVDEHRVPADVDMTFSDALIRLLSLSNQGFPIELKEHIQSSSRAMTRTIGLACGGFISLIADFSTPASILFQSRQMPFSIGTSGEIYPSLRSPLVPFYDHRRGKVVYVSLVGGVVNESSAPEHLIKYMKSSYGRRDHRTVLTPLPYPDRNVPMPFYFNRNGGEPVWCFHDLPVGACIQIPWGETSYSFSTGLEANG